MSDNEESKSERTARQKLESERRHNHRNQKAYAKRVNFIHQANYNRATNYKYQKAYKARKRAERRAAALAKFLKEDAP